LNYKDINPALWERPWTGDKYDKLVREWRAYGRRLPEPKDQKYDLRVCDLIKSYWTYAQTAYRKNGQSTSHLHNIKDAMDVLNDQYLKEPVKSFRPLIGLLAIVGAVRAEVVVEPVQGHNGPGRGLAEMVLGKAVGELGHGEAPSRRTGNYRFGQGSGPLCPTQAGPLSAAVGSI